METHRYTAQGGYGGKVTGEELCAGKCIEKKFQEANMAASQQTIEPLPKVS